MTEQETSGSGTPAEERPPRPRLRFVGPPGHPVVGRTLLGTSLSSSRLGVVQRLTEELGMTLGQIAERMGASQPGDPWAFCVVIYLTLGNAGYAATFAEVEDTFAFDDVEDGRGAGQDPTPPPQQPPTSRQTGSGRAVGGGGRGGRRRRRSGSTRR